MKNAAELEQELLSVGLQIYAIVRERGVSHEDYYIEDKAFCKLIKDYKPLIDAMYKQAEEESYYWRFCSLETYMATYYERLNQYLESEDGAEESDFLDLESERSIGYKPTAPILLELSEAPRVYCSNLDVLSASLFSSKVLLKKLKLDLEEKTLFYEEKVLQVEEQKAETRRARKERILHLANPEGIGSHKSCCSAGDGNNEEALKESNHQFPKLSLVEWGMVFYYMDSSGIFDDYDSKTNKMNHFIEKYSINSKITTFSNRCSDAKKKIEQLEGRSRNSLNFTMKNMVHIEPVIFESIKTKEKYKSDIAYIQEYMDDLEKIY